MTQQEQTPFDISDFINDEAPPTTGPIVQPKADFSIFLNLVDAAVSKVAQGMGRTDFADAAWADLYAAEGLECSDRSILETLAQADDIFCEMLALYDGKDPDPKPPTMKSVIEGNIEKADTAAAELDGTPAPTDRTQKLLASAKEAAKIDPSLGILGVMAAVAGERKPYSAKEQGDKTFTVQFFDGEARSFTARDYAKNYRNQSFREEGRAASDLGAMVERIERVRTIAEGYLGRVPEHEAQIKAAFDAHAERHIEFSLAYISNNSRLASAMITGPSNFPQRRQQKLNNQHHAKWEKLQTHMKVGAKRLARAAFPHGDPKNGIRSNNPDAVELLEKKIAKLEENQAYYKKANSDVRAAMKKADPIAEMVARGYEPRLAKSYTEYEYSWMKTRAFDSYVTTNNLAKIKTAKARLATLKATKAKVTENAEYELENGETFELVRNTDAMRIQLIFDGKPSNLTRAALKSNGFRWAPSHTAWQRHLNNNGEYALGRVLKAIDAKESGEA